MVSMCINVPTNMFPDAQVLLQAKGKKAVLALFHLIGIRGTSVDPSMQYF